MAFITTASEISGHLLLLGAPAWGHLRGLCGFAVKAVQEHSDICVTFMFVGGYDDPLQREISRHMPEHGPDLKARIRLVKLGGGQKTHPLELHADIYKGFPECYDKLARCEPVRSGEGTFPSIRSPTLVILDFFLLPVLEAIRARTGNTVPILAWDTVSIFMTLRMFGPEEMSGIGDVMPKAHTLAAETGRDIDELVEELSHPMSGALVHVPGLPPMYDYEWHPQSDGAPLKTGSVHNGGYHFSRKCDGYVCTSSSVYQFEAIEALRKWLAETGNRELYVVGPLVPSEFRDARGDSSSAKSFELAMTESGSRFQAFMEKTMKTHGKQSLIYISFGSFWWPQNDHVLLWIGVLLELGIPFIISAVSPKAHLPPELVQKVEESGIGMISNWSPQQTIFSHPVTGWVVTHCGQNTVIEALAEGLPMIAWPIEVDQPANAMHLTLNLDVAFELIEVRTGEAGLKLMYRGTQAKGLPEAVVAEAREVLHMARGEGGTRKRRNAEKIRDNMRMTQKEGGEGLEDMRRLLRLVSKDR